MSKHFLTLFSICALLCYVPTTQAANIYVDALATGANNGTSWTDAYTSIQPAVLDANAMPGADNILVASGYYSNTTPYLFTGPATLSGGQLYGFATTLENISGTSPVIEVAATDLDVSRVDFQNSLSHVVGYSGGMRFKKCHFFGAMNGSVIGRMCWLIRTDYCRFYNNHSMYVGGAITGLDCKLVHVERSDFRYNRTSASGGAIHINNPWLAMSGTLGRLKCENSFFRQNGSANYGGAIAMKLAHGKLVNSVFTRNRARNGGAITAAAASFSGAHLEVLNCTIFGNSAAVNGGGIQLVDAGTNIVFTEVFNSILWRNWALPASVLMKQVNRPPNQFGHCCAAGWGTLPWPGFANFPTNPQLLLSGDVMPASPCVDAGNPVFNTTLFDITMAPRIQGPNIDIGAFEQ